jgi:hypothetical protein
MADLANTETIMVAGKAFAGSSLIEEARVGLIVAVVFCSRQRQTISSDFPRKRGKLSFYLSVYTVYMYWPVSGTSGP